MTGVSLLSEIIEAHGGAEKWDKLHELRLNLRVGGNILALKFKSPRIRSLKCIVSTRHVHTSLMPFPQSGLRGVFDGESVRIETSEGTTIGQRKIIRTADGKVPRRAVWDDLDLLYFLGYSIWNYAVTPYVFLWSGFECQEGKEWRERDGSRWRTLQVTYPTAFPTHCRRQTFYFDVNGLLRRLDYTAEVFSPVARGAHYCEAHKEFDGLIFPTHRVVYARLGSDHPCKFIRVMEGWIEDVITA